MNDEVLSMTEPRKNKYELVGGNAVHSNPFGADPANQAVVEKRTEQAEDQFSSSVQMEEDRIRTIETVMKINAFLMALR